MKKNLVAGKILYGILIIGAICIAASSPYFALNLFKAISRELKRRRYFNFKAKNSQYNNTFYYLKRKGYLNIENKRGQIYISLTEEGKKKARKFQIDNLKIEKPKKWDRNWRIVIFDISTLTNIKRAALRGKLKELGFCKLQQSVWVYPYNCEKEIELLREFFGLNKRELRVIVGKIEEDEFLKKHFNL
jgi:DNA-binding transcriptional regulator PaaX